jgi:hypothetical protein
MNQGAVMTAVQMTCSHCSAAIDQEDRFCRDCGTRQVQLSKRFSTVLLDQRRKEEPTNPLMKAEMLCVIAVVTFVISTIAWCVKLPIGGKPAPVFSKKVETKPVSELDSLFTQAKFMPKRLAPVIKTEQTARVVVVTPVADPVVNPVVNRVVNPALNPALNNVVNPALNPGRGEMRLGESRPAFQHSKNVQDVAAYNKALADFFQKRKSTDSTDTADGAIVEPPTYDEWLKGGKQAF